MSTAILIPTLNRPTRVATVARQVHEATPLPHKIYWAASDEESLSILRVLGEDVLDDSEDPDQRYVTRMNKLVRSLGDEEHIFFGSDDVRHHPGWLETALEAMVPGVEVVVVNDLRNMNGTQAVIRREYLERAVFDAPGDAFHRGYLHNFADTEMFATASKRGVFTRAMGSIVEHFHPVFGRPGSMPWDDTYRNAQAGWAHDEALFMARMAMMQSAVP